VIWYRSAEECPDGPRFLEQLAKRTTKARLATVGDRVDFVVTLGKTRDQSVGRLERQTERGTVAIREVSGEDCGQVADALALTLALTIAPGDESAAEPPAHPTPVPEARAVEQPSSPPPAPVHAVEQPVRQQSEPTIATGVRAMMTTGVSPVALIGGGAFVDWHARSAGALSPSVRAGPVLLTGKSGTPRGELRTILLVGRLEGCPLGLQASRMRIEPCAGLDLGRWSARHTSTTQTSRSEFWASLLVSGRVAWVGDWLLLEAQAGVAIPATRYRLVFERPSRAFYTTNTLGFWGGIGAGFVFR
jgi:hypothetical protein